MVAISRAPCMHLERDQAGDAARALGDEAGQRGRVEDPIVHGDLGGTPQLGRQPLNRGPVVFFHRPDRHVPRVHVHHYQRRGTR